jgi:hypothetical protein
VHATNALASALVTDRGGRISMTETESSVQMPEWTTERTVAMSTAPNKKK